MSNPTPFGLLLFDLLICTFILLNQNKSHAKILLNELPDFLLFCHESQKCRIDLLKQCKSTAKSDNIKNGYTRICNDYSDGGGC
jgi:hypothetical protein